MLDSIGSFTSTGTTEESGFFGSIGGDRRYFPKNWARYFSTFIGNGVFPVPSDGLQVVTGGGMSVILRPGEAFIDGYYYANNGDLEVRLANADGVLNRIDRFVIRLDHLERRISLLVKSSQFATNPTAPPLQRDADAVEYCVADVLVGRGVTSITQSAITDHRFNTALCGIVAGVVQQLDASSITAQFDAFFSEYKPRIQETYNAFLQESDDAFDSFIKWLANFKITGTNDFENWFNTIRDILDEDAAGNIMLLIEDLQALAESRTPAAVIGTVEHGLNRYPICILHKAENTAGITGAGTTGAGGGNLTTLPADFEIDGFERVTVKTVNEFSDHTEINKINANQYSFIEPGNNTSLLLTIR